MAKRKLGNKRMHLGRMRSIFAVVGSLNVEQRELPFSAHALASETSGGPAGSVLHHQLPRHVYTRKTATHLRT